MAGYLIVTIHGVSDLEKLQTYRKAAGPSVQAFGGRPVVTSRSTQQIVEGDETAGVVMFKFPSYDQAVNWYNSSEYQEVKEIRMGAADVHMTIAEGMD